MIYEITAPNLGGGIIFWDGVAISGHTSLHFMRGWQWWRVANYCERCGWIFRQVRDEVKAERDFILADVVIGAPLVIEENLSWAA